MFNRNDLGFKDVLKITSGCTLPSPNPLSEGEGTSAEVVFDLHLSGENVAQRSICVSWPGIPWLSAIRTQAGFFKFVAAKTALCFAFAMAAFAGSPMASAKYPTGSDTANLQLSEVLPYRPGVYVWCDNAPLAFDSLFEFVSKTGKRNQPVRNSLAT